MSPDPQIMPNKLDVLIIGGGMIVHDQILPSVYQLQREGIVGAISVVATSSRNMQDLVNDELINDSFPDQTFSAYPSLDTPPNQRFPDLYKEQLRKMSPFQISIIAVPDQLHYEIILEAIKYKQHILCVKPLVLNYHQAIEIEQLAKANGIFVGIEYHKRFDRRVLEARRRYQANQFGEFIIGEAKLIEPYYYRHSNFQNWFTVENTDPFVYVGCHYTDMVYFITGLKPVEASIKGIKRNFPNGKEGFLWSSGRVLYENGAIMTVTNGLGYPDQGAGSNQQCLEMYFENENDTGYLKHNDQMRGVHYSYNAPIGPGGSTYNFINPDYFRLIPWEGEGNKPVGYGYDSIAANLKSIHQIEQLAAQGNSDEMKLNIRLAEIAKIDDKGIIATPQNSSVNELLTEAARLSILNEGKAVKIIYGNSPHVEFA